jgi:hypothetical protein
MNMNTNSPRAYGMVPNNPTNTPPHFGLSVNGDQGFGVGLQISCYRPLCEDSPPDSFQLAVSNDLAQACTTSDSSVVVVCGPEFNLSPCAEVSPPSPANVSIQTRQSSPVYPSYGVFGLSASTAPANAQDPVVQCILGAANSSLFSAYVSGTNIYTPPSGGTYSCFKEDAVCNAWYGPSSGSNRSAASKRTILLTAVLIGLGALPISLL